MTLVYCKTPDIIQKTFSNSYFFRKKEQIKNKHIRMIAVKKSTNKNKNIIWSKQIVQIDDLKNIIALKKIKNKKKTYPNCSSSIYGLVPKTFQIHCDVYSRTTIIEVRWPQVHLKVTWYPLNDQRVYFWLNNYL